MSLFNKIETTLKQALLNRNSETVEILKLIKSQILLQVKAKELSVPSDDICLNVIRKQIKDCQEALTIYKDQADGNRIQQTQQDLEILTSLLPEQLDDQALENIIDQFLDQTTLDLDFKNFKILLQDLEKQLDDKASRQQIATILQQKIKDD